MNLFVVGFSRAGGVDLAAAERALRSLLERLPFLPGAQPLSWSDGRAALVWATHPPEATGGVEYVATEPLRFALFAGRPFRWTAERAAEGRGPLDPRVYLDGLPSDLDGRFAAIRYDGESVAVASDPSGAYPLYNSESHGTAWWSNNPELVRSLTGTREPAQAVLASVLGGGWSLTGDPIWAGVRRLPAPPQPLPEVGAGFDAARAAALLTEATRALADWPGRPSVVPVTGGRDSRLVLAAALAAGIDFTTTTGAVPGSLDLELGRRLAELAGIAHEPIPDDPHGSVVDDWRRAAALLELTAAGTSTLADAAGYPLGPRAGGLALWHSGQGGEIARGYYGLALGATREELIERLYRAFVGRRPGRHELLSHEGAEHVRAEIRRFVDSRLDAGADASDVPDLFYLERRMGTWAGPTHGCVEYVRDTTSPLWSRRLLADELGLDARSRATERFHVELLRRLAPQLLEVPYEDGVRPGAARPSRLVSRLRRARTLARKTAAEARRRTRPPREPDDPFATVLQGVRELVLDQPRHPAWAVLDRPRVERLLVSHAGALDTMSRYYVWRLATIFSLTLGRGESDANAE